MHPSSTILLPHLNRFLTWSIPLLLFIARPSSCVHRHEVICAYMSTITFHSVLMHISKPASVYLFHWARSSCAWAFEHLFRFVGYDVYLFPRPTDGTGYLFPSYVCYFFGEWTQHTQNSNTQGTEGPTENIKHQAKRIRPLETRPQWAEYVVFFSLSPESEFNDGSNSRVRILYIQ